MVARVDIQSDQPQGTVVAEDPQAGTSVPVGSRITLSVSKGPATTQVPDVTGQNQAAAEAILSGAGLTPAVIYDPVTDPSQDGIVQSTDPPPGSDAEVGRGRDDHVGQLQTRHAGQHDDDDDTTTPPG